MMNHGFFPDERTRICISIAAHPGRFGSRFHNYLFRALNLNYFYFSRGVHDLGGAINAIRALSIHGCGVTMPFKSRALELVDEIDQTVRACGALNTIVNRDARLFGYNTDVWAVRDLMDGLGVDPDAAIEILGSGGMARAAVSALAALGHRKVTIRSRSVASGRDLARRFGYGWIEWAGPTPDVGLLFNATSIGFKVDPGSPAPFSDAFLSRARMVCDAVANPVETPLIRRARELGASVSGGLEIARRQAVSQFELYTGITPDAALVDAAMVWANQ